MSQKRFYTTVSVRADGPHFQVTLDDRPIKTPGGKAHALPTQALAEAIADEWRAQGDKLDLASVNGNLLYVHRGQGFRTLMSNAFLRLGVPSEDSIVRVWI